MCFDRNSFNCNYCSNLVTFTAINHESFVVIMCSHHATSVVSEQLFAGVTLANMSTGEQRFQGYNLNRNSSK